MIISGPLELLIIQGTPFCNINCSYCYLPNRNDKSKISIEVIDKTFDRLFESNLIQKNFTVVWHAGEPLVLPIKFYKDTITLINNKNHTKYKIRQNFQTNGLLLNQEWCQFIKDYNITISVSIDGPEFIHDSYRKTRNGKGTFKAVMKGIELLKKNDINFGIISVITDATLNHVNEFYNFFKLINPSQLGFNTEEIEGGNSSSTLFNKKENISLFAKFIDELYDLYLFDDKSLKIREFLQIEYLIFNERENKLGFQQQTTPLKIISVDINGNYSTFSPELLPIKSKKYNFIYGNVFTDCFDNIFHDANFNKVYTDILSGIIKCKNDCEFFFACGGGIPSNKFSELGSFDGTLTNHCYYKFHILFNSILSKIESKIT